MNRRLRIGSYLYHYPHSCGTTFAARGLSRGLARQGNTVVLYCCGPEPDRLKEENAEIPNRRVLHFEPGRTNNLFRIPRPLLDRLQSNEDQLDLMLIHGNFNPRNVAVAKAAHKGRIPYIVCPSSLYHKDIFRKHRVRKAVYGALFERPLLRRAAGIQVFTDSEIQALADYGVRRPTFVLPNGIEPSEVPVFDADVDQSYRELLRAPGLVYLGRIDMYTKGLDLLLYALAQGLQRGRLARDTFINFVGPDWGDRQKLESLSVRLGLESNIRFLGKVGDRERWSVLLCCGLLIVPSRHDSYPTTAIEAMVAGRALLISDQTGISALVKKSRCGFVVAPNVESLSNGLADALARRDEWPEMGDRGRQIARSTLTWDSIAENACAHYERILSQSQS